MINNNIIEAFNRYAPIERFNSVVCDSKKATGDEERKEGADEKKDDIRGQCSVVVKSQTAFKSCLSDLPHL